MLRRITAFALLILGAPAEALSNQTDTASPGPVGEARDRAARDVQQIGIHPDAPDAGSQQVNRAETPKVAVSQLPPDAVVPLATPAPETDLANAHTVSPEATLYGQVAAVWEVIRRRGQQPTPELIAREIGPDMLSRFLTQFPGSEAMFSANSDKLPVATPQDPMTIGNVIPVTPQK